MAPPARAVDHTGTTKYPELLCLSSVTRGRMASSTTSEGITPPSSLLRAHAPNPFPPPDFVYPHVFPSVRAGCCEPLLGTGSSRRYLCKSFPGCSSPDPVGLWGASACSFPHISGLPQIQPNGSASRIGPHRDVMRLVFRDRRYSLRSGLLVCSPPRSPLPLRREGRRAAVTFPPEQLTPRYRCVHRVG